MILPEIVGPTVLSFPTANVKLRGTRTATFSLPAGYTCPGACDCLAWVDRVTKKLVDGPDAKFRCYAASQEAAYPNVQAAVDKNLAVLKNAKTTSAMTEVIDMSLPSRYYHNIRIHADGDYFNQSYFLAWIQVAVNNPQRTFYGYTKSIPFWVKYKACLPSNFILTASRGGTWDNLIEPNNLRCSYVVMHPDEADDMGLEIDHNDSHARDPEGGDFALLIHGMGAAGSEQNAATKRMRAEGVKYAYGKASEERRQKDLKSKQKVS